MILAAVFVFTGALKRGMADGNRFFTTVFWRCITIAVKNNSKDMPVNEAILALPGFSQSKTVRIIGAEGEQIGLLQLSAALNKADNEGLDLVLMSAQADPPVCRIMDYGKFRFERDKKEKESRKHQEVVDIKEIQLSCHIDVNDFNTKVNHAIRFLKGGDKVKLRVQFRGRQMTRLEIGHELIEKFTKACEEYGSVEKAAVMEGRNMIVFIAPLKPSAQKAKANAGSKTSDKEKKAPAEDAAPKAKAEEKTEA